MVDDEQGIEYLRVEKAAREARLLVKQILWIGPVDSISKWITARPLASSATDADIEAAARALLNDKRYFGICWRCRERKPIGLMHESDMCQVCAADKDGVVY